MLRVMCRSSMPAVMSVVALGCALVAVRATRAGSFSFAVASSDFPTYFSAPSINDFGIVDYSAIDGEGTKWIYSGDTAVWFGPAVLGHSMSTNAPIGSTRTVFHLGIDNAATSHEQIIGREEFLLEGLADTETSGFSRFGAPVINDTKLVAFFAENDDGSSGVYVGRKNSDIAPITQGGLFSSFGEVVSINNSGHVALIAIAGDLETIIVTPDGSDLEFIASSGGMFRSFYTPSINDDGMVVFRAALTSGVGGIYVGGDGPVSTIADTAGPFAAFEYPVINDHGEVAFAALIDAGALYGIFTGPDPVADKVIQQGDPLFGSTLTEIGFNRALNNHGQIAFRYVLANGDEGIAIASPTAVPEATSIMLAGIGLGAVAALRLRWRWKSSPGRTRR